MDSYDEIFDFLNTPPDQRMACLKHLLNSTRAKLNDATKGKIYGRVCDFECPRTLTVKPVVVVAPEPPQSDSGSAKSSSNSKVHHAAKKKMIEFNITSEELITAGITGTGKGGYIVLADIKGLIDQKHAEGE